MATILEPDLVPSRNQESSDRSFGLVFAAVFALISCWPLLHLTAPRWWALAVATGFAVLAVIRPEILRPLNRVWLALGRLLHRIMSPLVMGTIFFLCVTPIGFIMQLRGRDVLSLKWRPDLGSYWIPRGLASPATETMKRQF